VSTQPFGVDNSPLLTVVADQAAPDQARLYQALVERERFAAAMVRLSLAVNATLKLDSVLEIICREAADAFGASTTVIWQLHGEQLVASPRMALARRSSSDCSSRSTIRDWGAGHPQARPITSTARRMKPAVTCHPAGGRQGAARRAVLPGGSGACVMVLLDRQHAERYADEDIARATVFGQLAAIAIHNAVVRARTCTSPRRCKESRCRSDLRCNAGGSVAGVNAR
jgi:GAF domain-containing protein